MLNSESTIQNLRVLHQLLAPSFPVSSLPSPVSAFSSPPFLQILSSCLKFTQSPKFFFLLTSSFKLHPSSFK